MSGKSRKSYIRKKPLNFGSSDEYERWKQRQRAILDEQEDKKNPSFTLYTFYYTYVECGHRIKNKKKCVIAAQTQYEAEQIFNMMADYFKIDRPQVRNIVEVYWLQKKDNIFVNFSYDYTDREVKEVYQDDYLDYYWENYLEI